jgi:hypothetical protein
MSKQLKIGLFLGAGASVPFAKPTIKQLRDALKLKYSYHSTVNLTTEQYFLSSILNFQQFEDIEHVLQCIKEIDDFTNSRYGGKYFLRGHDIQLYTPRGHMKLRKLPSKIEKMRNMIESDIFENYSWNPWYNEMLEKIYDQLLG